MKRDSKQKSKTTLLQALLSKDKKFIMEALSITKPIKYLLFSYDEGKIYLEEGRERILITEEEKEAYIKSLEKDYEVFQFIEQKSSPQDEAIID